MEIWIARDRDDHDIIQILVVIQDNIEPFNRSTFQQRSAEYFPHLRIHIRIQHCGVWVSHIYGCLAEVRFGLDATGWSCIILNEET